MKNDETRKARQYNKTVILEKLKELIMTEDVDSKGIKDLSRNVDSPDDAVKLVGRIECIIKSKKNNIFILAYHQGLIFRKFKENNRLTGAVTNLKRNKATIDFKIGIIKFIEDYPKMQKSSVSLHFLKNYFRIMKEVCREHASEFQ